MMLTLRPTRRFTSVDLPTFGRPSTATKPERKAPGETLLAALTA